MHSSLTLRNMLTVLTVILFSFAVTAHAAERIELTWVAWGNPQVDQAHTAIAEHWNKQNPDIHVTYQHWPSGYMDKVKVNIAAGTAPDLINLSVHAVPEIVNLGGILDLTSYAARDNLGESYFKPAFDGFQYQEKQWGIPREGGPYLLNYNRDLFEAAGVTPPTEAWTMDDFEAAAQRLTRVNDGTTEIYGSAIHTMWPHFLWSFGGRILDQDGRRGRFSTPQSVDALEWMTSLIQRGYAMPGDTPSRQMYAAFENGQLAMVPAPRGRYYQYIHLNPLPFNWGMELMPKGPAGRTSFVNFNGVTISAHTKHPEAAWKFLKWAMGEEGWTVRLNLGVQVGVPLNIDVLKNERYLDTGAPFISREENMRFSMGITDGRLYPVMPEWPRINSQAISPNLTRVLTGEISPSAGAEVIDRLINGILQE